MVVGWKWGGCGLDSECLPFYYILRIKFESPNFHSQEKKKNTILELHGHKIGILQSTEHVSEECGSGGTRGEREREDWLLNGLEYSAATNQ